MASIYYDEDESVDVAEAMKILLENLMHKIKTLTTTQSPPLGPELDEIEIERICKHNCNHSNCNAYRKLIAEIRRLQRK